MSWWPVPWNALAETIRMAALTNSASISAMVESAVAHLMASRGLLIVARLHNRGVQVKIVGHDGRADDADGDIEHRRVGHDFGRGNDHAVNQLAHRRRRRHDLNDEAGEDHGHHRDDEGFEEAKALVHQEEKQERIEPADHGAGKQRNMKQELQRDRRADDLGEVAGYDREFAGDPQREIDRLWIVGAASLSEISSGDDAES